MSCVAGIAEIPILCPHHSCRKRFTCPNNLPTSDQPVCRSGALVLLMAGPCRMRSCTVALTFRFWKVLPIPMNWSVRHMRMGIMLWPLPIEIHWRVLSELTQRQKKSV